MYKPADEGERRDIVVRSKCSAHSVVHQLEVLVLEQPAEEGEAGEFFKPAPCFRENQVLAWVDIADLFGGQVVNMRLTLFVFATLSDISIDNCSKTATKKTSNENPWLETTTANFL